MATVFETTFIGNIGRDAAINDMGNGLFAINFPVAHNKNWRERKSGNMQTRTTWINCTLWKKNDANLRVVDFLKKGTLVELKGTPVAKGFLGEDGQIKAEIRLNVENVNILRSASEDFENSDVHENQEDASTVYDYEENKR